MKILYLLSNNEGLGVARKLAEENNAVHVFILDSDIDSDPRLIFVDSWRECLTDMDLVIAGSLGFERYEEVFKKFGKPYLGASKLGRMLTQGKLTDFLEICGVPLSTKEPKCARVGFFNGRSWITPVFYAILDQKLAAGDLGPNVGAMGTSLMRSSSSIILNELTAGFSRMGLRDMVTVFQADDGITGIGCGFVYDILECIIEGMKDRVTDLFFELATGTAKNIDFTRDLVVSVKLTVPPFPYLSGQVIRQPIQGLNDENLKHVYLDGVQILDDGYMICSASGCVLKAAARGRDLREARRRVYRTLENLETEAKQYRIDIGQKAQGILNQLEEHPNE